VLRKIRRSSVAECAFPVSWFLHYQAAYILLQCNPPAAFKRWCKRVRCIAHTLQTCMCIAIWKVGNCLELSYQDLCSGGSFSPDAESRVMKIIVQYIFVFEFNDTNIRQLKGIYLLGRCNATTQGTQTPPKKRVATQGHKNPPSGGVLKCVPRGVSWVR